MLNLWTAFQSRFVKDEEGASMVEYALLVALISIIAIVAITAIGVDVRRLFGDVATELEGVTTTT